MAEASDISHLFGSDVGVTPTGDIALVTGSTRTRQRIIRRLCTPSTTIGNSAYPWEPPYGCGLPAKIGDTLDDRAVQSDVLGQVLQEASVAPLPTPQVTATPIPGGGATIDILYSDQSGTPDGLNFDLTP